MSLPIIDPHNPDQLLDLMRLGACYVKIDPSLTHKIDETTEYNKWFFQLPNEYKQGNWNSHNIRGEPRNLHVLAMEWDNLLLPYSNPLEFQNILSDDIPQTTHTPHLQEINTFLQNTHQQLFQAISQHVQLPELNIHQSVCLNFYPEHQDDLPGRLGPHVDNGTMTFLLTQDPGLSAKIDNQWHNIDPIPGYLIVNLGSTLEQLTDGACHAIIHRVARSVTHERQSMAFFYGPKNG